MMCAMSKKVVIETLLTIAIMLGITTLLFLYTSGYRLQKEKEKNIDLKETGMISAKSLPKGATIFLDGKAETATDDTLAGILPGIHTLRIVKNGYIEWKKDIEVFPELVTDITAVLVSQTPRLEPLTNTGAKAPSISPSLNKLAYFSKDPAKPGIWIIPLGQGALSLFRSDPYIVIQDKSKNTYSDGKELVWSPDEKKILVETDTPSKAFLVDLQTNTAQATSSVEPLKKKWTEETTKKIQDFIERLEIPQNIKEYAVSNKTIWSPDDKKFLYTVKNGDKIDYKVYNMEKPIPVGEKVDNLVFTLPANVEQPKITWYYDSFHLITTTMDPKTPNRGTISMIRIDGTNNTEIYNNSLYSDQVYSAPGGDKLIILTSFKSGSQSDLYTIGIK